MNVIDPTLSESIQRLETADVIPALHGALSQAKERLRPAEKAKGDAKTSRTKTALTSREKRTLACTVLALLQHASGLSVSDPSLRGEILSSLVGSLKQCPWMWELFVRHYFSEFMASPSAAELFAQALCEQTMEQQARGWAVLASQLRTGPVLTSAEIPSLLALQQMALLQVKSCFQFLTVHQMPLSLLGKTAHRVGELHTENILTAREGESIAKVDVLLKKHLPAALQVTLCPKPTRTAVDDSLVQRSGSVHPQETETAGSSANSGAWNGEGAHDHGVIYAAILIREMCNPESLAEMLSLRRDGDAPSSMSYDRSKSTVTPFTAVDIEGKGCVEREGRENGDKHTTTRIEQQRGRLISRGSQILQIAMLLVPVLVEALVTIPGMKDRTAMESSTAISTMLAIRWELAQLLAATGAAKLPAKLNPAPWSLQTSIAVLRASMGGAASYEPYMYLDGQDDEKHNDDAGDVLVMPPAVVAHALEMASAAMPFWKELRAIDQSADKEGIVEKCEKQNIILVLAKVVVKIQKACFGGVFQPHLNILSGAPNEHAMRVANRIHALLIRGEEEKQPSNRLKTDISSIERFGLVVSGPKGEDGKKRRRRAAGQQPDASLRNGNAATMFLEQLKASVSGPMQGGVSMTMDAEAVEELSAQKEPPGEEAKEIKEEEIAREPGCGRAQETKKRRRLCAQRIGDISNAPKSEPNDDTTAAFHSEASSHQAEWTSGLDPLRPRDSLDLQRAEDGGITPDHAVVEASGDSRAFDIYGGTSETKPTILGGRVVMTSTLLMDDAAREAMWKAYIEDKERMVEMMGDSSYREYYDESAHPTRMSTHPASTGIDAAFDAVFGKAGDVVGMGQSQHRSASSSTTLPQTILETSLLYPWQAGLAAALSLLRHLVLLAETLDAARFGTAALSLLATPSERKDAAATALKALQPNHSRNSWLGVQRTAESNLAAGCTLHYVSRLHALLHRTSRRTAPPTLSAFLLLAKALLARARREEADLRSKHPTKAAWMPLHFVGPLVRSFSRFPPLLVTSMNKESASCLPILSVADPVSLLDSVPYLSGLLWLSIAMEDSPPPGKPEWLREQGAELMTHPLGAAGPACRSSAVDALLPLLVESTRVLRERLGRESICAAESLDSMLSPATNQTAKPHMIKAMEGPVVNVILPLLDACAMALRCLFNACEKPTSDAKEEPSASDRQEGTASILPSKSDVNADSTQFGRYFLAHRSIFEGILALSTALCSFCSSSSAVLAQAFERESLRVPVPEEDADEIESLTEILALGLDFADVVQFCLDEGHLWEALKGQSLQHGGKASLEDLQSAAEVAVSRQVSCIEVLRSLPEDHAACQLVMKALESAPQLSIVCCNGNDGSYDRGNIGHENNDHRCRGLMIRDARGHRPINGSRIDEEAMPGDKASSKIEQDYSTHESDVDQDGYRHGERSQEHGSRRSAYERRRRLKDIRNPYLRAIVAESGRGAGEVNEGDLSDLEDFIVANPDRDYGGFIAAHFPMAVDSEDDGEEEEEEEVDVEEEG